MSLLHHRVHAIADVSTVHLSTEMALMCYSDTHQSLYWKKNPKNVCGLKGTGPQATCCCDWILNDGVECVYTVFSHEEVAVFNVELMGKATLKTLLAKSHSESHSGHTFLCSHTLIFPKQIDHF